MIQNILDRYRMTKLSELDWITQNRLKVKKEKKKFDACRKKHLDEGQGQNILFWCPGAWERGGLEHMMSFALKLRGHHINGIYCGGGYPSCSMENYHFPRPECEPCVDRALKLLDIFDLKENYHNSHLFISQEELQAAHQMIDDLETSQLRSFEYEGFPVGLWAHRDLPQYYLRIIPIEDESESLRIRNILKSTLIYTIISIHALDKFKPDRCIVTSGKTLAYGPFFEVCKSRGIPILTWEENPNGKDAFVFKYNDPACNYNFDQEWSEFKNTPYTEKEKETAIRFYARNAIGKLARRTFYEKPIRNIQQISEELGLVPEKKKIVLLTNLTWDTSSLGRDIAFEGMLHWVTSTIDHLSDQENVQVIVRAHPAEGRCPADMKSTETVTECLMEHYQNKLPDNVILIDGFSEINSHILCKMSDLISVYSTTVGLEMAMRGRPVIVCGECHYSRKGFTIDVNTKEEYLQILDNFKKGIQPEIPNDVEKIGYKYAYFFINKIPNYVKEFNHSNRHIFTLDDPLEFLPGNSQFWDDFCNNFVQEKSLMGMQPNYHEMAEMNEELMKLWRLE